MKVVIDTNILVSAVIRDRLPERVLLWCLHQIDVEWLVTPAILDEYTAVIKRPKFALTPGIIDWWTELLVTDTVIIEPTLVIEFPRDRKDAPFLVCAQSGAADYLITGDGDFTEAQSLIDTRIVSVREFANLVAPELLIVPNKH